MENKNWAPSILVVLAMALMFSSTVFADDTSRFNGTMYGIQGHRMKIETQLNIMPDEQKRTLYNSASLGHYEKSMWEAKNVIAQAVPFNKYLQFMRSHRGQVEGQLNLPPDSFVASSYYDDKEAHYEQVLIRSDEIDMGIR